MENQDADFNLRVAFDTDILNLANSIIHNHEEGKKVTLSCVGPSASHRAIRAICHINDGHPSMRLSIEPSSVTVRVKERGSDEMTDLWIIKLRITVKE